MTEIIKKQMITLDKTHSFTRALDISTCAQEILRILVESCADNDKDYGVQILIIEEPSFE